MTAMQRAQADALAQWFLQHPGDAMGLEALAATLGRETFRTALFRAMERQAGKRAAELLEAAGSCPERLREAWHRGQSWVAADWEAVADRITEALYASVRLKETRT